MSSTATSNALLSIPVLAISGEDGIAFSSGTSECGLHHHYNHHHSLNTTTLSTPPCLGRQSSNQSIKHIRSLLKPYHTRLRSQKDGGGSTATSPTGPGQQHLLSDPTADLLAQFGSGSCASTATLTSASSITTTSSPFSPITPISSSAGYFQAAETLLAFQRNALYHHCPTQAPPPPPPQRRSSLRPTGLLTPVSTTPANQTLANPKAANLTLPVFSEDQGKPRPATSPVVFSAEYLEARLAKKGDDAQPQQQESVHRACPTYTGPSADLLNLLKDFPYASAYVDVSTLPHHQPQPSHRPQGQDSGVVAQAAPSASSSGREEEIRKQKYAVDLIETAIKTIHKIWPETQEPEREAMPGPVTSDGKLRASFVVQSQPVVSPPEHKATARLRRKPSAQQFTPESSPDSGRKKRKRAADAADEKVAKRSCVGEAKEAYPTCPRVLTPPVEPKPEPVRSTSSAQQSHHISLKLFVRELLRRSKTSCNTLEVALCYLDGIEETVKKLRDCLKLGIAFGTVAMAERGPYDEGMKDEGRIITAVEWMKQEAMKQEDDGMDVRGDWPNQQHGGQDWAPTSPTDLPASEKGGKVTATIPPTQVLATHPLLDARRTFLASLVLATKFIQDKAYSNKAWAKLSGLAGKEVGRCERALGGALQWRLWVGKDCGASSSIRSRSPVVNEEGGAESLCSGDSDSVVHGENDPLAKAFMEEASKKQMKGGDVAGYSAPAPLAPAEVVARLYGGETSRAGGAGRARTWHAPEKVEFGSEVLPLAQLPLPLPSCTSTSSSSAVSVASCSTLLDQLSTFNLVTPLSQASQSTVVDPHTSFGLPFVHSPLSLEGERFLESLLKGGEECEVPVPSTVKIVGEDGKKNRTPVMSMATSFPNNEPLPSAGFMDQWQLQQTFPFTFTAPLSSAKPQPQLQQQQQLPRLSIPKPRQPVRSYSVGSILLHPQTAALRSGSSPNSSSTFSSPEVLTPVHSRAGTLVLDVVGEQEWMVKGREFQQCVDQLYCGGVGQFSAIPVQM